MNEDSQLARFIWKACPVLLIGGTSWMGSGFGILENSSDNRMLGGALLMFGLLGLYWKICIIANKLNIPD